MTRIRIPLIVSAAVVLLSMHRGAEVGEEVGSNQFEGKYCQGVGDANVHDWFYESAELNMFRGFAKRTSKHADDSIRWWMSSADLQQRLTEQPVLTWSEDSTADGTLIEVTPAIHYQTMLGFGSSLEPATCANL